MLNSLLVLCVGGTPSAPAAPPKLPAAPTTPAGATPAGASDVDKRRRRAAAGGTGTILTGARGIQDGAAGGPKTLLGA